MWLSNIKQFNWMDILVVTILLRIGYIAIKIDLIQEFFKLLGTFLAAYLALHSYIGLSNVLARRLGKSISLVILDFLSFIILAIFTYLIFVLVRKVFLRLVKVEPVPMLDKWGGFVLGVFRAILTLSIITYIFVISPLDYFKNSVRNSYSGKRLLKVGPSIYIRLWNGVISKFTTEENFNQAVLEVQETLKAKE